MNLRDAAQQALEALTAHADLHGTMYLKMDAITALKAALAEPMQEPVCDECRRSKADGWALYCVDCMGPVFDSPQRKLSALITPRGSLGEET